MGDASTRKRIVGNHHGKCENIFAAENRVQIPSDIRYQEITQYMNQAKEIIIVHKDHFQIY
jgi:hypothetical protein